MYALVEAGQVEIFGSGGKQGEDLEDHLSVHK